MRADACQTLFDAWMKETLSDEGRAHAAACEPCRALVGSHRVHEVPPPAPPLALGGVFREELRRELAERFSTRPSDIRWWAHAFLSTTLHLTLLATWAFALGADNWMLSEAPRWRQVLTAAALVLSCGVGSFVALMPGARRLRMGCLAAAAVLPAWVLWTGDGVAILSARDSAWPCVSWVVMGFLGGPAIASVLLLSGFAWGLGRTVLALVASACVGLFALQLHCLDGSLHHLALFHLLPAGFCVAVGVAVRALIPSRSHVP